MNLKEKKAELEKAFDAATTIEDARNIKGELAEVNQLIAEAESADAE